MKASSDRQMRGFSGLASFFATSERFAAGALAALALLAVGCHECDTDADCEGGKVCEAVPVASGGGSQNQCVTGCHEDSQCDAGQSCEEVVCITTPCPGQCGGGASQCGEDSDCAEGFVCELSTGCEQPSLCVAGCRSDTQCPAGQSCVQPQCFTCPCPGFCAQ